MGSSGWLSQSLLRFAQKLAGDVPVRLAGDGAAEVFGAEDGLVVAHVFCVR